MRINPYAAVSKPQVCELGRCPRWAPRSKWIQPLGGWFSLCNRHIVDPGVPFQLAEHRKKFREQSAAREQVVELLGGLDV